MFIWRLLDAFGKTAQTRLRWLSNAPLNQPSESRQWSNVSWENKVLKGVPGCGSKFQVKLNCTVGHIQWESWESTWGFSNIHRWCSCAWQPWHRSTRLSALVKDLDGVDAVGNWLPTADAGRLDPRFKLPKIKYKAGDWQKVGFGDLRATERSSVVAEMEPTYTPTWSRQIVYI